MSRDERPLPALVMIGGTRDVARFERTSFVGSMGTRVPRSPSAGPHFRQVARARPRCRTAHPDPPPGRAPGRPSLPGPAGDAAGATSGMTGCRGAGGEGAGVQVQGAGRGCRGAGAGCRLRGAGPRRGGCRYRRGGGMALAGAAGGSRGYWGGVCPPGSESSRRGACLLERRPDPICAHEGTPPHTRCTMCPPPGSRSRSMGTDGGPLGRVPAMHLAMIRGSSSTAR